MYTPVNERFALGWQVSRMLERKCIHHSGGANGYVADFLRFKVHHASQKDEDQVAEKNEAKNRKVELESG